MNTQQKNKGLALKLGILWMVIFLLFSFQLTLNNAADPVSLVIVSQAPREGEAVTAVFKLNNPASQSLVTAYQFYANGDLVDETTTTIAPESNKTYQYTYKNALKMGEQVNFFIKTQSEHGNYEKHASAPAYPPQVWSSFVSFATFSTTVFSSLSVMGSISSMGFYQGAFGSGNLLNIGVIAAVVLLSLLIFLEMSRNVVLGKPVATLGRLRLKFSTVTWILLIIFLGMVYTRILLLIAT
ncbi:MAG: hypothetical protein HYX79_04155 [Chloroflexi bacterium]|nr:hypothetical protein [Chloroflexota bacterium]